jgi:hypothetical protein
VIGLTWRSRCRAGQGPAGQEPGGSVTPKPRAASRSSTCRSGRQRAARVVRCGERGSPRAAHGLAPQAGLQRLQVEPSEHHIPTAYPDRVEEPTGRELSGDGPGGVQVGRVEEAARITVLAKRGKRRLHALNQRVQRRGTGGGASIAVAAPAHGSPARCHCHAGGTLGEEPAPRHRAAARRPSSAAPGRAHRLLVSSDLHAHSFGRGQI